MKPGQIFLLLAVVVVCSCAVSKPKDKWNNHQRHIVKKYHNDLRESEYACYMNMLDYNLILEMEAYFVVQQCDYTFDYKHNFGQNVAYGKPEYNLTTFLQMSLKKMMEEKSMYRFNQKGCGRSCRYTQMANSVTRSDRFVIRRSMLRKLFTVGIVDNTDNIPSSTTASDSFHGTDNSLTQLREVEYGG
ncbi:Cap protein [Plakobranchus ocellatus]|uniref:Cap protein n=1 Tax=Plakobranchus ocellatus TaxID=259542 RepID=A0AAV3YXG8_9GAST|nr:Cap protein [Plakobranchus ocellatus]